MSNPDIQAFPHSGENKPVIIEINEVLPAPFLNYFY